VYEICAKAFLEGTFMCTPSFLVREPLTHSLKGTLLVYCIVLYIDIYIALLMV